jgi:hypothetical protein
VFLGGVGAQHRFARNLGGAVRFACQQRKSLDDRRFARRLLRRLAVDGARRQEDDAARQLAIASGFEQVERAEDVRFEDAGWEVVADVWARDAAGVDDAGDVVLGEELLDEGAIGDVADDHRPGARRGARGHVEADDLLAAVVEKRGQVRAEEAFGAGDENGHGGSVATNR